MKLVDVINLGKILRPINKPYFFYSKSNNKSNKDTDYILIFIYKVLKYNFKDVEKFCKVCIKSDNIGIV